MIVVLMFTTKKTKKQGVQPHFQSKNREPFLHFRRKVQSQSDSEEGRTFGIVRAEDCAASSVFLCHAEMKEMDDTVGDFCMSDYTEGEKQSSNHKTTS